MANALVLRLLRYSEHRPGHRPFPLAPTLWLGPPWYPSAHFSLGL